MSLEVKVFREVLSYRPRVIAGLTWPQVLIVGIIIVITAAIYVPAYMTGHETLGMWPIIVAVVPLGLLGWVRPMGLPFAEWFKFVWRHFATPKRIFYRTDVDEEVPSRDWKKEDIREFGN